MSSQTVWGRARAKISDEALTHYSGGLLNVLFSHVFVTWLSMFYIHKQTHPFITFLEPVDISRLQTQVTKKHKSVTNFEVLPLFLFWTKPSVAFMTYTLTYNNKCTSSMCRMFPQHLHSCSHLVTSCVFRRFHFSSFC